jgi:argininosuccinate lyase
MPQKKNPDGAELARSKPGRLLGNLSTLAVAAKGLPLAYNKDLQEDKEAVFDAADTVRVTLEALCATLEGITFNPERCSRALDGGHHLATEVADYLVRKGTPFRTAHGIAGELVRLAEAQGVDVSALSLATYQSVSPEFGDDVHAHVSVPAALAARASIGGTSPVRVAEEIARWEKSLGL